jgi:ketosteroid isomerase-like protein
VSEENVQLTRQAIDAWNRGDLDEWARSLHEEIVWYPLAENPQPEPIHGVDAVMEFVSDWLEPWDDYKVEVAQLLESGDWVVMSTRQWAKHQTGGEISVDMHAAAAFRDGKVIEWRWFMNEAGALRAAGIDDRSSE